MRPVSIREIVNTHQQHHSHAQPPPQVEDGPVLCPYCGSVQLDQDHCDSCTGLFEPLSRQATQNQMGPWFVRDAAQPFRPGCNYPTLKRLVERGIVCNTTILRGPTTHQFWTPATRTPGVAHLLGICHNCAEPVEPEDYSCASCGAIFTVTRDRQHLGLGSIRLLPGSAPPDIVAESTRSEPGNAGTQSSGEPPAQYPVVATPQGSAESAEKSGPTPQEAESIGRQITRDDDVPVLTKAANRRLRQSQSRMRWFISILLLFNIILVVSLAIILNPRLGFRSGESTPADQSDAAAQSE